MDKQKYIMIGTKTITKEIFRNVLRPLNNYYFLPTGGFWSAPYNEYTISPWFDYLIDNNDSYLSEKNIKSASIFTLKDEAKILTIDNYETLKDIIEKYPSYHHLLNYYTDQTNKELSINYELLSKDYDGIYVNYKNFEYSKETIIFKEWDVNTLLLFNLDVIDEYISANIKFYLPGSLSYYSLEEEEKHTIQEESICHKEIVKYVEMIFNEYVIKRNKYYNYDDYFTYLIKCVKKCIKLTEKNKNKKANTIKDILEEQGINTTNHLIIRNICINALSNYLRENVKMEQNLSKTKKRESKEYKIEENKK